MRLNEYDKNRLEYIFDTYYDKVYAFLYFRVRNTALAEDLASQTFLKVAENHNSYNPEKGAMSTWIFTIALNRLRSNYRACKSGETIDLEDMENLHADTNVETEIETNETKAALLRLLDDLNERQRSIVTLKYYGEFSNKEIGGILNISVTNVSTILNRAIKKLKSMLEQCDEFPDFEYKGKEGKDERLQRSR